MMKNAARLDTHGAGQVTNRRAFEALVAKQVRCRLQQFTPRTVGVDQLPLIDQFTHDLQGLSFVHSPLPIAVAPLQYGRWAAIYALKPRQARRLQPIMGAMQASARGIGKNVGFGYALAICA
ncbi:hypothetical protein D9M71_107080 [compost metagenome]